MSSNVFYFFIGMFSNVNYVVLYFWVLAVFYYQKILIYCVWQTSITKNISSEGIHGKKTYFI